MMTGSEDKSQMNTAKNVAIVLAAGQGRRMHSDVPKQFLDLCGRPVAAWSLQAFQDFPGVDAVILVTSEEDIEYCQSELIDKYRFDKVKRIVSGGAERYLSVWKGLQAAKEYLQEMNSVESIVFIHDGARPVIDAALLDRALACAVGRLKKRIIAVYILTGDPLSVFLRQVDIREAGSVIAGGTYERNIKFVSYDFRHDLLSTY